MRYTIGLIVIAACVATAVIYTSKKSDVTQQPSAIPPTDELSNFLTPQPPYVIRTIIEGLNKPRDILFTPDDIMLVTDLADGAIYAYTQPYSSSTKHTLLKNLDFPHSIALDDSKTLYIATKEFIVTTILDTNSLTTSPLKKFIRLPAQKGARHQTRTLEIGPDGFLYISIGSTCDACKEKDDQFGALTRYKSNGEDKTIIAKGLRNTTYFTFDQQGNIWGNDMGQDNLGDNLPPDELNLITENNHYGWPYCYGNNMPTGFDAQHSCKSHAPATIEYPAHSAPLGITIINSPQFPDSWQNTILSALHGSWSIKPAQGYKIVHINQHTNPPTITDFITGFNNEVDGEPPAHSSHGRPASLTFGPNGDLYITDDKKGVIYKVFNPQTP